MYWMQSVSPHVAAVPSSGIRKFFDAVEDMEDVVSLGVGEPDFPAPPKVIEAARESLARKETHYTSNWGLLPLREEISKLFVRRHGLSYDPKGEILVTVGVSEALALIMTAYLSAGDEVLMPDPAYLAYPGCVSFAGGVPVLVPTFPENDYKLTVPKLEKKVTPKTKMLLMGFPNNPTGTVMTKEDLLPIAEFAKKHDLIVVSDEIYCDLTYEGTHTCFASLPWMKERTLVLNGFSKSYAMTGMRLGYILGPAEALEPLYKVHQYDIVCAAAEAQYGGIAALRECEPDMKAMVAEYHKRRDIIYEGVREMGLPVVKPQGAFYLFPDISVTGMDDETFADRLLEEERVAVIPGSCFGECGRNHVRISYAASRENIAEALARMKRFVEKYRK